MHLLSLLAFLVTGFHLALGVYLLKSNPRAALNRIFFLICVSLAFWSFGFSFLQGAPTKEEAWFWFKVSSPGWTLTPSLLLHFLILLVRKEKLLDRRGAYVALYAPAFYFFGRALFGEMGVVDFVETPFGWSDVYGPLSVGYAIYLVYFSSYILYGLWLVWQFGRQSEVIAERRQAAVLVYSGAPVLVAVAISGIFLPWAGIRNPPEVAHLIALLWVLVIWNAVSKYKLMLMTPAAVAPNILRTMVDAVILLGRDRTIVTSNKAARRLFAASGRKLEGLSLGQVFGGPDSETALETERFLLDGGENLEVSFRPEDGDEIVLRVSTSEVLDYFEQPMGEVLVFRDVTAEKRAEADLRYLATHDSLTDLPNRSLLQDRLDRAVSRSQRESVGFAVIMFDLDDFKRVNDDIDHVVGDAVLKTTARRLAHCVRGLDTVCRLGGDEFLLVVEDLVEVDEADIIARRIMRSFEEPMNALGHSITVTGSIGISTYPADSDEPTTLVKMADLALNTAKQAGRGLYRFFSPNMEASNRQRIQIENGLQDAIGKEELYLAYQPLFDFEAGHIAGVEALIRWNSPELGQLAPMEFIPVAERSGLIVKVGEWVLRTACQQNVAWQEAGFPKVPISVNVSARQLREEDFAQRVVEIIEETGLDPRLLEIELTETAVMENLSRSRKILDALADAGVRLVIDDFGTGYSSLARLRQLPIEAIKVDRSFIENICEDERDLSLVMAIVAMARNLGLQVVAEGVETLEQLKALNGLEDMPLPRFHCDRVQGFLFSKPVGGAELARLFTRSESEVEPFRSIRRVLHETAA